jgi:preprotein translocase subunit YajC
MEGQMDKGGLPDAAVRRIEDFIGSLDSGELRYLQEVVSRRQKQLARREAASILATLSPGDSVFFNAGERRMNGRVLKLNRQTVTVECADGRLWRVPAQLIYRFR